MTDTVPQRGPATAKKARPATRKAQPVQRASRKAQPVQRASRKAQPVQRASRKAQPVSSGSRKAQPASTASPRSGSSTSPGPGSTGTRRIKVKPEALPDETPQLRLPILGIEIPLPAREQLPFVVGVVAVAAFDLIDWPVALVLAAGHLIASNARNRSIRELAEGLEAAG